jgi:hypothetical protein
MKSGEWRVASKDEEKRSRAALTGGKWRVAGGVRGRGNGGSIVV